MGMLEGDSLDRIPPLAPSHGPVEGIGTFIGFKTLRGQGLPATKR